MGPFFQVCIVVDDLDAAMRELTDAVGFTWTERARHVIDGDAVTVVFSIEGPPHVELVDGSKASGVWATGGSPRVHHIAFWSDAFAEDCTRLEHAGLVLRSKKESVDRQVALYESDMCGTMLELIPSSRRARFSRLVERSPA